MPSTSASTGGVLQQLEVDVANRTLVRIHAEAPKLSDTGPDEARFQLKPCYGYGVCICGDCVLAKRFHSNLVAFFRPYLRVTREPHPKGAAKAKAKKPVPRLLMEQGMFVFKFQSMPLETEVPDVSSSWEQICDSLVHGSEIAVVPLQSLFEPTPHESKTIWAHVSFVNYRDWTFSFSFLEEAGEATTDSGQKLTVLKVPNQAQFETDVAAFKTLFDLKPCWIVSAYVIYADAEILPDMDMAPDVVEVTRLMSIPELRLWKACRACFVQLC